MIASAVFAAASSEMPVMKIFLFGFGASGRCFSCAWIPGAKKISAAKARTRTLHGHFALPRSLLLL